MKNYYLIIGGIIMSILLITMGIKLYYQYNSNTQDVQIQSYKTKKQSTTNTTKQHHKVSCKATHEKAPFTCSRIQ